MFTTPRSLLGIFGEPGGRGPIHVVGRVSQVERLSSSRRGDADPFAGHIMSFGTQRTTAENASSETMDWGAPALWSASSNGETQEVLQLLKDGVDIEERGGPTLSTPLFIAVCQGQEGVVRVLLKHGADPSAQDCYGWTPLHRAANRGREGVVRALLEYGADMSAESDGGETASQHAADWGHNAVVELLLVAQSAESSMVV